MKNNLKKRNMFKIYPSRQRSARVLDLVPVNHLKTYRTRKTEKKLPEYPSFHGTTALATYLSIYSYFICCSWANHPSARVKLKYYDPIYPRRKIDIVYSSYYVIRMPER